MIVSLNQDKDTGLCSKQSVGSLNQDNDTEVCNLCSLNQDKDSGHCWQSSQDTRNGCGPGGIACS